MATTVMIRCFLLAGLAVAFAKAQESSTVTAAATTNSTGTTLPSTPLPVPINTSSYTSIPVIDDPHLAGQHFRITAVEHSGYLDIKEDPDTGKLKFSGYLIDILEELAKPHRANFTYELTTPSGFGSLCNPRLTLNESYPTISDHPEAFHPRYRESPVCGESDVNDRPLSQYSTDMYWGIFYITAERLKVNKFTMPYSPPDSATMGMMGTATHIHSIHDLAASNKKHAVCAFSGTANFDLLQLTFPQLDIHGLDIVWMSFAGDYHAVMENGTCEILIDSYPLLKQRVLELYNDKKCLANGLPIGIIGEPLEYGPHAFAFGIRNDLPDSLVQTLNFWMEALMACFPQDPNGYCPNGEGSISHLFALHGGIGNECGYVQFPELDQGGLPVGAIVAIALIPVLLVVVVGMVYHMRQLKQQEKRMKKRFIQQLARNIDIGDSARQISAQKLSEAFQHIGGQEGLITKADLAKWMNDLHLDFLSEQDFNRLWDTMDMDGTGYVDPIEFIIFLNACEKEVKEVHEEWDPLPKTEKRKLAFLRLSNIKEHGEEEVKKMQRRHNRGRM
ncbi:expressed unknown protein [Seminavis robusta]|uniref:EF-hand domain-containing protein n=1 Tax=Seminavis robusta TaxID=568900 RepID=A0A9N8HAI9_9STRA|nr:expressed unknown protein [Seminavis robusta]|eukprot:Sro321_g116860.1 n/a (560) ;mRNA; f:66567-68246